MQWEYYRLSVDALSVESALHELGQNGWELVSVLPESRIFFGYQCFLKRPTAAPGESDGCRQEERAVERSPEQRRLNKYIDVR